jgi:hypothetical protein
LRRRADRAVGALAVLAVSAGAAATLLVPVAGGLVVNGETVLSRTAVMGWALYAAATATVTPYGSLAAVRGRQAWVLGVRAAESVISIGLVIVALAIDWSAASAPYLLASAALASGATLRRVLQEIEVEVDVVASSSTTSA